MHVFVQGASKWLDKHVKSLIQSHVPDSIFVDNLEDIPKDAKSVFQFGDGWDLADHFNILNSVPHGLMNAYPNSDALARKDYLARVVDYWTAKRPDSILRKHIPTTVRLSLDYAEYVDEALSAAEDLTLLQSLEQNEAKDPSEREWWILKPALIDCGLGIRLFSTIEELASHLELAEYEYDDDDDDEEEEVVVEGEGGAEGEGEKQKEGETAPPEADKPEPNGFSATLATPGLDSLDGLVTTTSSMSLNGASSAKKGGRPKRPQYVFKADGRIPSAQMREFVAQRYIVSIPPIERRKWHVRAYVLSVGRLRVHVFREMLALLAVEDYRPPWEKPSLRASLTNTALQDEDEYVAKESMRDFWAAAPDDLLPGGWKQRVFEQACDVTAELFRAAVHTMADKFTTVERSFELFALDFLVDTSGNAWLLEANESPAFYPQGAAGPLALRLMESMISMAMEHMGSARMDEKHDEAKKRFVQVLDETSNLAKSRITEIVTTNRWGS